MSPKKVYLDSMVTKSKEHVVRVKVTHKRTSPQKEGKQTFQRLLLVDQKGQTMRAALFGHNVDYFDDIIQVEACYDISNVVVASINDKNYEHFPDEKQMHINTLSSVKRVAATEVPCSLTFNCTSISNLPHDHVPQNASFDVIAIVLEYIPARKVPNKFSSTLSDMSELHITDDSCSEVVRVFLYNEWSFGLEILVNVEPREAVILLSGLKTKLSPDLSLSSTYYTKIDLNPNVARANILRQWYEDHHDTISSRTFASMNNEVMISELAMTTIKCAKEMKANDLTSKTMVKIAGFILDFSVHNIRVSICCNWCGRACKNTVGESYICNFCNQHALAMSKLFFDFIITDGTGSLKLAAHTKNAEKLLRTKASAMYSMTTEEHTSLTTELRVAFRDHKTEMIVSPVKTMLVDHKRVIWMLKSII